LKDDSTSYIISGGGGAALYGHDDHHDKLVWGDMRNGFASLSVEGGEGMKVDLVSREGEVLYSTTLQPNRRRLREQQLGEEK